MANRRKKEADQEIVATLTEQVSGDERTRHEREPLGLDQELPIGVGSAPEDDPQFRPMLDLSASPIGDLPTHEGYGLDAETHFRRRRSAIVAAGILTAVVAVGWIIIVRGQIMGTPADADAGAAAIADTRARFTQEFGNITAVLAGITPRTTSTANVSAAASLQNAITALHGQLAPAAPASSTPDSLPPTPSSTSPR